MALPENYLVTAGVPARFQRANIRRILESWASHHSGPNAIPWITHKVEQAFTKRLHPRGIHICACMHDRKEHRKRHGKRGACRKCECPRYVIPFYVGKIDVEGWQREDTRRSCVVDHKTTFQVSRAFSRQYDLDAQMTGYLWGTGADICYINAVQIDVVPVSNRKCAKHGVQFAECYPEHVTMTVIGPIDRTKKQMAVWHAQTLIHIRDYWLNLNRKPDETLLIGAINGACKYCEFFDWCRQGRPLKRLHEKFTKREWKPWPAGEERDDRLFVDNSIIKSHVTCHTQARMRHGEFLTTEDQTWPLDAGTACHAFFESYFDPTRDKPSVKRAMRMFDKSYNVTE